MTENRPFKIAIASGKGGTGKTLISTNLFFSLLQQNHKVTLVDCDAEEPNTMVFLKGSLGYFHDVTQKVPVIDESKCSYCAKCHDYCSYNALFIIPPAKIIKVMDELCHGCGACLVACEQNAICEKEVSLGTITHYSATTKSSIIEARMKVGVYSPVAVIKAAIKEATNADIIILDSPPGTSCPFIQTVISADFVILVTEPTPFGLSDLKQSVETLKTMNKQYGVIVNRAGLGNNAVYEYMDKENIPLLMEIPFDIAIAEHYSNAQLVAQHRPEWEAQLIAMYDSINKKYGNCNN